jgi:hypothetical protein
VRGITVNIRKEWQNLSLEWKLSIIAMPLLLTVISGVVVPRVNDLLSPHRASLKVIDTVVSNGTDWEKSPEIQVTLHNTGSQRSIIKRALFRIRSFAALPICAIEGELMVSKTYDITLPTNPREDEAPVEKPVSQQLAPDEADRFAFSLSVPPPAGMPTVYLYQLEIEFLHDEDSTPLKAGNVIVALPGAPGRHGMQFWSKSWLSLYPGAEKGLPDEARIHSCLDSNTAKLRKMLALDGVRSNELSNLPSDLGKA